MDMFTLLDKLTKERLVFSKKKKLVGLTELMTTLDTHLYQVYWNEGQEDAVQDRAQATEVQQTEGKITMQGIVAALILPLALYLALV